MKSLLLLRHAKSSWKEDGLADHDRPLKKRGKRDAPKMGELLRELNRVPQLIVASTAERARKTALLAAEGAGFSGDIRFVKELYAAGTQDLLVVVRALPDAVNTALLVAHNPGLEDLIAAITGKQVTLPTAGLAAIDLPIEQWVLAIEKPSGKLAGVWKPKELGE